MYISRKSPWESVCFWIANIIMAPIIGVVCLVVNAQGLRSLIPLTTMKIWKVPIPGFDQFSNFSGWEKIEISHLAAIGLLIWCTYIWYFLLKGLSERGKFKGQASRAPVYFWVVCLSCIFVVAGDAIIFCAGLSSRSDELWAKPHFAIPVICSIVYTAGMVVFANFHKEHYVGE